MYTPVNPSFTIRKCGVRGCTLHGHVSVISGLYKTLDVRGSNLHGRVSMMLLFATATFQIDIDRAEIFIALS